MDAADCEETKDERPRFSDDSCYSDDTSSGERDTNDRSHQPPKKIITKAAKPKPTQQQDVQAEAEVSDLQCGTCHKTFKRKAHLKRHREQRDKPCEPPQQLTQDAKRRQQILKADAKYKRSDKGKAKAEAYYTSGPRKESYKEYDQRRKDDDDRQQFKR